MPLFQTGSDPSLIIDPSLESNAAGPCSLHLVASDQMVQLSLLERRTLKVLALEKIRLPFSSEKNYAEKIKAASQLLKNHSFQQVKLVVESSNYTLVPESLFKPGEEYRYYRLNFHTDLTSVVMVGQVSKYGLFCLYGVSPGFADAFRSVFPDTQFYHHMQVLLNNRFVNSRNDSAPTMSLNIRQNQLDIIVSEGKKLLLTNSFRWQTMEDILYYSLFVCEQLGLNPEKNKLILSGSVERSSAIYKLLENYFSSISFDELPGLKTGYGMEEMPFSENPVIYGLSLCE